MSDHDEPSAPPTVAQWVLSVAGIVGSILIVASVIGVAYLKSSTHTAVDANISAERTAKLQAVQAKQLDLYNNYSVVDATKGLYRIPVDAAMKLTAARLGDATRDKPPAPARLTLAASPAGFTPPPPATVPAPAAPAAAATPPAAPAAAAP